MCHVIDAIDKPSVWIFSPESTSLAAFDPVHSNTPSNSQLMQPTLQDRWTLSRKKNAAGKSQIFIPDKLTKSNHIPLFPDHPQAGPHSLRSFFNSPNLTGFVRNKLTPLLNASCCASADARPVKATIIDGFWCVSFSSARILKVDSMPFITGIEMSVFHQDQLLMGR